MVFNYEIWLKAARDMLETLYQQKAAIEDEISQLQRAIQGFEPLVKNRAKWFGPTSGITHAIRALLKSESGRLFTATDIRDELLQRGVALRQKNPMATIHQILHRLVQSETVKVFTHEPGRNHYKWQTDAPANLSRRAVEPPVLPKGQGPKAKGQL